MITMKKFIEDNRKELDVIIWEQIQPPPRNAYPLTDDERESWVLNHEPLYLLAQQAGVDV